MAENETTNAATDGGAMRKQLEDALAANKELGDKLKTFEAKEKLSSVGDALSAKGYAKSVAKFVPDDVGSDPVKLDAWLKDNLDVFAPTGESAAEGAPEANGVANAPEGAAQAFNKIEAINSAGKNSAPNLDSLQAQMKACKTPAELDTLLAQYKLS